MTSITSLEITTDKLAQLRQAMVTQGVDLLVVPSSDEFLSEYVPPHLNRRAFLTGFTGSAGDALIGRAQAWVFVDGRYHTQADTEVDARVFTVAKLGQPEVLGLSKQIAAAVTTLLESQSTVTIGVPAGCVAQAQLVQWQKDIPKAHHASVIWKPLDDHPVDAVWEALGQRPEWQPAPWQTVSDVAAGKAVAEKLAELRKAMADANVTHVPITALDEIAWLYNIRGGDLPHTPVGLAYGWVTADQAYLCVANLSSDVERTLAQAAITVHTGLAAFWQAFPKDVANTANAAVWIDCKRTPARLVATLSDSVGRHEAPSPIEAAKAVKNPAELNGMRESHLAASVALITAWHQLETALQTGHTVTEGDYAQWIHNAYAAHSAFQQLSFPSIVGAGGNGAIVHYHTDDSDCVITPGELLLFDSGAQYCCDAWMGTTDTTRTVLAVGTAEKPITATPEQQLRYTQVLKSHLAVAGQTFPEGTNGAQLDAIARGVLWRDGVDFLHGTGHGVGCYLGVHEGPCGIGKGYTTAFAPGMITSNEPGFYQPGWGGIRLENLMTCVETDVTLSTTGERLLGFEPLMWVPFDLNLVDPTHLTGPEREALNQYHQGVLTHVLPRLDPTLSWWLMDKCREI